MSRRGLVGTRGWRRSVSVQGLGTRPRCTSVVVVATLLLGLVVASAAPASANPSGSVRLVSQGDADWSADNTLWSETWDYDLLWESLPSYDASSINGTTPATVSGRFTHVEYTETHHTWNDGRVVCKERYTATWDGTVSAGDPGLYFDPEISVSGPHEDGTYWFGTRMWLSGEVDERHERWYEGSPFNPYCSGTSDDTTRSNWHAGTTAVTMAPGEPDGENFQGQTVVPIGPGDGTWWSSLLPPEGATATLTYDLKPPDMTLKVTAGYNYGGGMRGAAAKVRGKDYVRIEGSEAALARVKEVCIISRWKAATKLHAPTSTGIYWNGEVGPFNPDSHPGWTLERRASPSPGEYAETVRIDSCGSARGGELPLDITLTGPGRFVKIKHAGVAVVTLTNGEEYRVRLPQKTGTAKTTSFVLKGKETASFSL